MHAKNVKLFSGFTLIEILVVIAVLLVISAITIPGMVTFRTKNSAENSAMEIARLIELAKSKAMASEDDEKFGVYFDYLLEPSKYILFKGDSYATREAADDLTYSLPEELEFYNINLSEIETGDASNEVVFGKLPGISSHQGNVSLRRKADISQSETIYISSSGMISLEESSEPDDSNRIKDSRRVRVGYNRQIDTLTESIVLDFNNGEVINTLPISQNLLVGEFDWRGTVNVGGSDQELRIYTNGMSGTDARFIVHRDRRYNNSALKISISGDAGYLLSYSADGLTIASTSIYAGEIQWQ